MRYSKPLIAELGRATTEIQGAGVKGGFADDADPQDMRTTGSSYDLDE